MSFIADNAGYYNSFGTDAAQIALDIYELTGAVAHLVKRGASLNDGVARLVGVTHDATSSEKFYVGATQEGSTNSPGVVDNSVSFDTLGVSRGSNNPFDGDMAAVLVVDGVISGGDLTKLHAWAQQRFGTA